MILTDTLELVVPYIRVYYCLHTGTPHNLFVGVYPKQNDGHPIANDKSIDGNFPLCFLSN